MTTPAASLNDMLEFINPNVLDIADPTTAQTPLKPLLQQWRLAFFPLLDQNDVSQAKIHQWIVPTLALESVLENTPQTWWEIDRVIALISNTTSAFGFNGYIPSAPQLASVLAVWNAAWT